ncbi:MAG: glycosyltransferase [Rhodovarius sp.]|nr:glycosyltransferase [Rhodovarius sp.]MCX7933426.1 glycosyltransferase [Rhodovarius sp.]
MPRDLPGPTTAPATAAAGPDILMLSAAHPPDDVRIVRREGAALAAAGFRVRHLCPARPGMPAACEGVEIAGYSRAPGWRGRIAAIPRLARLAREAGARAIHAHEPDAWLAGWLARPPRLILDVHEHYPSRLDARLPRLLRPFARGAIWLFCRMLAARADAVVLAKDGLGSPFGRGSIAVRNYAPDPGVPPRRHGPGPLRLLHVGALSRARGWPQMLEALRLCPPDTELVIAGRFTDGSEGAFLARAAELGLTGRIQLAGWLAPAELARLAAGCDVNLILFQPGVENHRLALPHKLADGMWAGLPVIAPAFAEEVAAMVASSGAGLLVDVTRPEAIAQAVHRLADPGLRQRLGDAARAAVQTRYSWAGEAERLVALYRGLLGGRR